MAAVAKRYAKALFEVAQSTARIDAVEQDLILIEEVLGAHPDFKVVLMQPHVSPTGKKEQIERVFGAYISAETQTLLKILIDRNREDQIEDVVRYYIQFANEARNLADATVTTTHVLTEEQRQQLTNKFAALYDQNIRLTEQTDASILGGMIVKIGDRRFDGSIKGKLNRFERRVLSSKM